MRHDVDVAVIGGGLGGLACAARLAGTSTRFAVFEQATRIEDIGAGIAIGANATRLLARLGVDLEALGVQPPEVQFRRWDDGRLIWSHPVGDWYRHRMGAPLLLLHRGTLRRALQALVPPECIHPGHRLTGIREEPDGVHLGFADWPEVTARLVVGFDGLHSVVRSYVADASGPTYSGEIGFRGLIPATAVPEMPAPDSLQIWVGPGTHVVSYGVDGGLVNLLAVHVPDRLPDWTGSTNRTPGTRSQARALLVERGWDRRILELVDRIEGDMHFWALQDMPPLPRWSRGRVVLAGDAAHAPLPHQGQGAGQALEDAYVLASVLADSATTAPDPAFARFEQLRRARARRVQLYSRQAGRLFKLAGEAARRRDADLPGLPERLAWIHAHRTEDDLLAHRR
jgi:salicylate hydroxylase